jgi:adenine nucleotide transporter 17
VSGFQKEIFRNILLIFHFASFFYFYFYSFLRSYSTRRLISVHKPRRNVSTHKPGLVEELLLGFIAGVASRAVSTPLNIVTLRLQTERQDEDDSDDEGPTSVGMMGVIKDIYNEQGLAGFWRGMRVVFPARNHVNLF